MNYQQYREKFDALQLRERMLLLLVIFALIYALWTLLIDDSQSKQFVQLNQQLLATRTKLQEQRAALAIAESSVNKDPDAQLKREVIQLEADIATIDARLSEAAVGLVPAAELPRMLEAMVSQTSGLKLKRLETLPIEQLQLVEVTGAQATGPSTGVFRHTVQIELQGTYFAIQAYMQALQTLNWRFYWDSLEYEVESYPTGVAKLVVYTLSTERGVVGD